MSDEMVSLKVDQTMVESVLQKQIQAAIVSQLGNQEQLIGNLVNLAMTKKVDAKGNTDSRDYYNKYEFLEVLTTTSIQTAAKEALKEWLADNATLIKAAVLEELKKPDRQRSIATAYADAIEHSLKCSWGMSCNILFENMEE